jgi:hypothetical protein
MSITIKKTLSANIDPIDPNSIYFVKTELGADVYISDENGTTLKNVKNKKKITVKGPLTVTKDIGGTLPTEYIITNYDSNEVYNILTISGSYIRVDDIIYYSPPANPGVSGFIINDQVFNITVEDIFVVKPSITDPINNSANINTTIVVRSSDYLVSEGDGEYVSTDWQLSLNPLFTTILLQNIDSTTDINSWVIYNLNLSTTYYVRVRYKDLNIGYSSWSDPVGFTTGNSLTPGLELNIINPPVGISIDNFGYVVNITPDGTRAFISSLYNGDSNLTNPGIVYIYTVENNSLIYEDQLISVDPASNEFYGNSLASSNDGSVLVVGCSEDNYSGYSKSGSIYIYERTGVSWTQIQQIFNPNPINDGGFGHSVSISGDGNTIVVGAPFDSLQRGTTYVYEKTGLSWTLIATLFPPGPTGLFQTGYNVKISKDGTRIISGCYWGIGDKCSVYFNNNGVWEFEANLNTSSSFGNGFNVSINENGNTIAIGSCYHSYQDYLSAGIVYIYIRSGNTWTLQQTLTPNDISSSDYFGSVVELNNSGDKILVTSRNDDYNGYNNSGSVYIFTRTANVWNENNKITPFIPIEGGSFGSSLKITGDNNLAIVGSNNVTSNISTGGNAYLFTV